MSSIRVIPCLLLQGTALVKTTQFGNPTYLGDPQNILRIFNDKEVDEIILLDIRATTTGRGPQFDLVRDIVSEAFMPVAYGGGIRSRDDAARLFSLGVEKVVLSLAAVENPLLVKKLAEEFGSQSIVVCMDIRKDGGSYEVVVKGGGTRTGLEPREFARKLAEMGVGELVVYSVDRDGTMAGYDLDLIAQVSKSVNVPVIACGGAGNLGHMVDAVRVGGASAVAAGSMFVFFGRRRAVLITYPSRQELEQHLVTP